ncbi:MAG: hypothetical protein H7099_07535 [Gemmatimonadaceae bacterium]|nr:hypothetical protein [Gemmatimonadaceae bacterium]
MRAIPLQAEREAGDTRVEAGGSDEAQIARIVAVEEEHALPAMSALREVVSEAGKHNAGESGHVSHARAGESEFAFPRQDIGVFMCGRLKFLHHSRFAARCRHGRLAPLAPEDEVVPQR